MRVVVIILCSVMDQLPSSAPRIVCQPAIAFNCRTACALCLRNPDKAYMALERVFAELEEGDRADSIAGKGSRVKY